jgi:exodeoxyribonuclease-3
MSDQSPCFNLFASASPTIASAPIQQLKILAWNLQGPSLERAQRQLSYLRESKANVLVLSELKAGNAFDYVVEDLQLYGFRVFSHPNTAPQEDYHTLIASKECSAERFFALESEADLGTRAVAISVSTLRGVLAIIGVYCPTHSRFASPADIRRKLAFHQKLSQRVRDHAARSDTPVILVGDLNILEPDHKPDVPVFRQIECLYRDLVSLGFCDAFRRLHPAAVEHSWISPLGDERWRLDHIFVDLRLAGQISLCSYDHSVRYSRLSDHSAISLLLDHTVATEP